MISLKTEFLGLSLKNPIIIGSSGLTDQLEKLLALEQTGAGAIVLKSLFEEEITREMMENLSQFQNQEGIFPETAQYLEDDISQEKTEKYLGLIKEAKSTLKIPVIASINCITSGQWTFFPKRIEEAGADALELNIFNLPSDIANSSEENEKVYFDIIEKVYKQINIPIGVKISYYSGNLGNFIFRLSKSGIKSISLFNRFYNIDFDINTFKVTNGNVLSNPEDIATSLRWVALMSSRVSCDLAATTGIHDATGVIKQILAGAKAVQIASSLYLHGIDHVRTMLEGLETWMIGSGFENIDDFRGKMAQDSSNDPAALERVQFMKYFKDYKK